jgi:hypothetical protein
MVGYLILTFEVDHAGMVTVTSSECAPTREEVEAGIRRGMH